MEVVLVEPVPETARVLARLRELGESHLASTLDLMARRAKAIVPECVGFSLGLIEEGLTFTLVSTDEKVAGLDAAQYLEDGPCVTATERGVPVEVNTSDLMDEKRWLMFARASSAAGVASTLSLPIVRDGRAIGSVNLYASSPDAFTGHRENLAEALGAWAEGAVTNADLSFTTRLEAGQAPARLADHDDIAIATGVIARRHDADIDTARTRLRRAASRAGISEGQAARALKALYDDTM